MPRSGSNCSPLPAADRPPPTADRPLPTAHRGRSQTQTPNIARAGRRRLSLACSSATRNSSMQAHPASPSAASLDDPPLSRSSCLSCRQLKRRCSRQIPHCALCMRVGRTCEYDSVQALHSSTAARPGVPCASASRLSNADRLLARGAPITPGSLTPRATDEGSLSLEAIFLDSVRCRGESIALPSDVEWADVCVDIPPATTAEAGLILRTFFASTHTWLPIGAHFQRSRAGEPC